MQRALELTVNAGVPVPIFTDSTTNCDQQNTSITTFLIPTKAGAVPVGAALHSNQTTANYEIVMQLMKKNWQKFSFVIECFISDDSKALKGALKLVWPDIVQLLCQFHVVSFVWNWLFVPNNGVSSIFRPPCIQKFRGIMYASDEAECEMLFDECVQELKEHKQFVEYLSSLFARKEEWAFAYRKNILNRSHNTNNMAEINFRLLKDIILSRLKAHNAISLLSFLCNELDEYFSCRFSDVSFGRAANKDKLYNVIKERAEKILEHKDQIIEVHNDVFSVPSAVDKTKKYTVNASLGTCSCLNGSQGSFCKHQCAISLMFNKEFLNCPKLSANDKKDFYYLANGTTLKRDFFLPLKETVPEIEREIDTNFSDKENLCDNTEESSDWSDCEGPPNKKQRLESNEEFDETMQNFDKFAANARKILSNNKSDSYLLKNVNRFSAVGSKFETGVQLAGFLATALERHKRGGKKIPVQPMNINRRKANSTSRRVLRSGRPASSVKVSVKRKRNLALNISLNQRNGKSHGSAH